MGRKVQNQVSYEWYIITAHLKYHWYIIFSFPKEHICSLLWTECLFPPRNSPAEGCPRPKCDGIWRRSLWEVTGSWEWNPHKKRWERNGICLFMWEHNRMVAVDKPESGPSPAVESAGNLDLRLHSLQNCEKSVLLFQPHSVVIATWTKTPTFVYFQSTSDVRLNTGHWWVPEQGSPLGSDVVSGHYFPPLETNWLQVWVENMLQ